MNNEAIYTAGILSDTGSTGATLLNGMLGGEFLPTDELTVFIPISVDWEKANLLSQIDSSESEQQTMSAEEAPGSGVSLEILQEKEIDYDEDSAFFQVRCTKCWTVSRRKASLSHSDSESVFDLINPFLCPTCGTFHRKCFLSEVASEDSSEQTGEGADLPIVSVVYEDGSVESLSGKAGKRFLRERKESDPLPTEPAELISCLLSKIHMAHRTERSPENIPLDAIAKESILQSLAEWSRVARIQLSFSADDRFNGIRFCLFPRSAAPDVASDPTMRCDGLFCITNLGNAFPAQTVFAEESGFRLCQPITFIHCADNSISVEQSEQERREAVQRLCADLPFLESARHYVYHPMAGESETNEPFLLSFPEQLLTLVCADRDARTIPHAFSFLTGIIPSIRDENLRASCEEQLNKLKNRYEDPEFRLAIIGNFSCGKSTFLNALLKRRLLSAGFDPTTAVPTFIRWNKAEVQRRITGTELFEADDPLIIVTASGKQYAFTQEGYAEFLDETGIPSPSADAGPGAIIDYLTTTNDLSNTLDRVELYFPEREEFRDFCLIDTPGVNPGSEESANHIHNTQLVLQEQADAAIVLYPVNHVMAMNMTEFIAENAEHMMKDAMIFVTKSDLVEDADELTRIQNYVVRVSREHFRQKDPSVYCISAARACAWTLSRSDREEDRLWAEQLEEAMRDVIGKLSVRRQEILSKRISQLMLEMTGVISESVADQKEQLKEEQLQLENASENRLLAELNQLKTESVSALSKKLTEEESVVLSLVSQSAYQVRDQYQKWALIAKNTQEVSSLTRLFSDRLQASAKEVLTDYEKNTDEIIDAWRQTYCHYAEQLFVKYQRYLGEIQNSEGLSSGAIAKSGNVFIGTISFEKGGFLDDHGALVAALPVAILLASAIAMPIGLLIGGAAWLLDRYRLDQRRQKARDSMHRATEDLKRNVSNTLTERRKAICQAAADWATNVPSEYFGIYQMKYEEVKSRFEQQQSAILQEIESTDARLRQVATMQKRLSAICDLSVTQ